MDEFEGIDLDAIANSDSAVIEATDIVTDAADVTTEKTSKSTKVDETNDDEGDDPDVIDLDVLEDLEEGDDEDIVSGKGTNKAPSKSTATSSSQNKFTSLASAMREEGALGDLDDEAFAEITSSAELIEAMSTQAKVSMYENTLNEDQREYLDAMEAGVPQALYQDHKADVTQYLNLTDERIRNSTQLTHELIKRAYIAEGLSAEKAATFSARDMEGESVGAAGIEARNALVASENAKLFDEIEASKVRRIEEEKTATANLAALKSKVNETADVIPGVTVNATTRTKTFKSMTNNVSKKGESPVNEVMSAYESDEGFKIKLHTLYVLTNGLKDFSKFTQSKNSDIAAKLDAKLKSSARSAGSPMETGTGKSTNDIRAALAGWEYGK